MIERYARKEISEIWSEENKFKIWLEIELLAIEARVHLNEIPKSVYNQIKQKAKFNIKRIKQIEEKVHHDVIAFITDVAQSVGEVGKYIHYGMTSSDVLDTCLAVQIKQASQILLKDLEILKTTLSRLAKENKYLVCIGRTHGVHAELTTYGLKFALWYDEICRNIERLKIASENASVGKISGAVGTYEHLNPEVEKYVCKKLGIKAANISTQIVQRDVHAEYLLTLALIAASIEKFATEIRHLQKTEVREVEEPFVEGQRGSSAMPHKRNPILCERIAGLARLIRTNAFASLENINLWHERDISHSSVERIIFPDTTILLDYILDKMNYVLANLKFYKSNIEKNVNLTKGLIHSQKVLLFLVNKGFTRDEAYKIVQSAAMKVWEGENDFLTELKSNSKIKKLIKFEELEKIFDSTLLLERVDYIFQKLGLD
ncbi:MAG: adenylosuccinate lyase [Ignavibacteria bacterium]|nr:adenylosuccinate lyase [Ignavibacteria bacterium]